MIPGARLLSSPSHYAIAKELVASENAIGTRLLMFSSRWVNVPSMACPALLALLAAIRSLLWSRAQVHAEALAIRHLSPRPSGRSLRGDRTDGVKMGGGKFHTRPRYHTVHPSWRRSWVVLSQVSPDQVLLEGTR